MGDPLPATRPDRDVRVALAAPLAREVLADRALARGMRVAMAPRMRTFAIAAALLASFLPRVAAAGDDDDVTAVTISGGAGVALLVSDPCGLDGRCSDDRRRVVGAAPLLGAGLRWTLPTGLRLGGRAELAAAGTSGGFASLLGEMGVATGPISLDAGAGLAAIWYHEGERDDRGGSLSFTLGAGYALTSELTLAARAELHAFMHAPLGAAFAGLALEWSLH